MVNTPTFSLRQNHLKETFGFTCTCALCRVSRHQRKISDCRLDRMLDIDSENEERVRSGRDPLVTLCALREGLRLAEREGLGCITVASLYQEVADLFVGNADAARASVFARREYE
jgi:hypothetical protein